MNEGKPYIGIHEFIRKHWRGDYSLGQSYWINTILVQFVALVLGVMIIPQLEKFPARYTSSAVLALAILGVVIWFWGIVGTWASASKHVQRGGREGWATMAKAVVLIGILSTAGQLGKIQGPLSEHLQVAMGAQFGPSYTVKVSEDGKSIIFEGGMNDGAADSLLNAINIAPAINTVVLNSPGGWVREGMLVANVIKERQLNTYVEHECSSACTLAFIAGRSRYAGPAARIGFHKPSAIGSDSDTSEADVLALRSLFLKSNVASEFIDRVLATPPDGMWYPTQVDLESANVLTQDKSVAEGARAPNKNIPVLNYPAWGSSLQDIMNLIPAGHVVTFASGERHYRAEVQFEGVGFAIATYCFREKTGLQLLILEFIGAQRTYDLASGDYSRPSVDFGLALHEKATQRLTRDFGKPTYIAGASNSSGLTVFGARSEVFVRIDHKILIERSNVVVQIENREGENENGNQSSADELIIAGLWRNPADSWVGPEAFKLRWGMGPGDVKDVYPDIVAGISSADEPIQKYHVDDFVEGNVGIDFEFYKGRLVSIAISPFTYSKRHILQASKGVEALWADWALWKVDIQKIVTEKYGSPEDTGRVQAKYADNTKDKSSANSWRWKNGETGIELTNLRDKLPVLTYLEIATYLDRATAQDDYEKAKSESRTERF